jgi:hypothetical protein
MVVHPHDADRDEAQGVAEIRGPLVPQCRAKVLLALDMGDRDLDDQQRDSDGDDAVAKRLQARGVGVMAQVFVVADGDLLLTLRSASDRCRKG